MNNDPLDKAISVGAELTKSGLNVNAKSRAVAAIDRLLGNWVDYVNLPVERRIVQERTRIEGERLLVDAVRDQALERMKSDPDFADRAIENYLRSIAVRQENKDRVAQVAIEDLQRDSRAAEAGPELDPAFLNRLERHAEDASSEALREKWGRVLAAEIRTPGTISLRVMRVVDEIDASTAALFERLCTWRLERGIPFCLCKRLEFMEARQLVGAGLLVDPGQHGQIQYYSEATMSNGRAMWFVSFESYGVGFLKDAEIPVRSEIGPIRLENGRPGIQSYLLTTEGYAISRILPDQQDAAFEKYAAVLQSHLGEVEASAFRSSNGKEWIPMPRP
jgi:hypothetical protein